MSDPTETAPAAVTAPSEPVETAPAAIPSPETKAVQTPSPSEPRRTNYWARVDSRRAAAKAAPKGEPPEVKAAREEAATLRATIAASVDEAAGTLSEGQRAWLREVAGDDPIAAHRALTAARKHGLLGGAALAAPASTAPAPAAPRPAEPADTDAATLAEYERLSKAAPIRALAFKASNEASISRALKARPS